MKRALIPVRPQIQLEAFQLDTKLVRYVCNLDVCEVRLSRLGTETREFGTIEEDLIVLSICWVRECIEFFRRLCAHALLLRRATRRRCDSLEVLSIVAKLLELVQDAFDVRAGRWFRGCLLQIPEAILE